MTLMVDAGELFSKVVEIIVAIIEWRLLFVILLFAIVVWYYVSPLVDWLSQNIGITMVVAIVVLAIIVIGYLLSRDRGNRPKDRGTDIGDWRT